MAIYGDNVNGRIVNIFQADSIEIAELIAVGAATPKQCSIGDVYFEEFDEFRPVRPYESWTWDSIQRIWDPPYVKPGDGFYWDEDKQEWLPTVAVADPLELVSPTEGTEEITPEIVE